MQLFVKVYKNKYVDSLETLYITSVVTAIEGVETAYVAMATQGNKEIIRLLELYNEEIDEAKDGDLVITMQAETEDIFIKAIKDAMNSSTSASVGEAEETYLSTLAAVKAHPDANICIISVPGEYALDEVKKAMDNDLHCFVFSANVPPEDELRMKEIAMEKGLLCMGPDCGVANINGAAFMLGSITNRGPFGICGASGCGVQHVGAMLHDAGTGVSQIIGTGGGDLKEPVGGISMLMGLEALENDPDTSYIVLISRKPAEAILKKLLEHISRCEKKIVAFFMGATKEEVEASGAIWAENLDDCGQKALALVGKECLLAGDDEIGKMAREAIKGMNKEQKYVRGAFLGGTYCDEAMRAMQVKIGPINSNAPLAPELRLADSNKSIANSVIDYGEEEFTIGRPHPTIDGGLRKPAILKEANDPETAVLLMDFILSPPGLMEPVDALSDEFKKAQKLAESRGGRLAIVAAVLGTDADFQNANLQREKLREAGVYVCQTNYRAALLAGEIIRLLNERDAQ